MYHDIITEERFATNHYGKIPNLKYTITSNKFKSHLRMISGLNLTQTNTTIEIVRKSIQNYNIIFTFDDGKNGIIEASTILEHFGYRGYFFVVSSRIGTSGYVNANQLRKLHQKGHIIGNHTNSHPEMISFLKYDEIVNEWLECSKILYKILGEKVNTAAVPGGFCSKKVIIAAETAGIRILFNSEPSTKIKNYRNMYIIGRYNIPGNYSDEAFFKLITGKSLFKAKLIIGWNIKRMIKNIFGKRYVDINHIVSDYFRKRTKPLLKIN
jgi:peptidoglycan/xylan/chitin deacetylase (PgdA/CDA1 family)